MTKQKCRLRESIVLFELQNASIAYISIEETSWSPRSLFLEMVIVQTLKKSIWPYRPIKFST